MSFHELIGWLYAFLGETYDQILYLFLNWVVFLFLSCKGSLYILHMYNYQIDVLQIFPHSMDCLHFLGGILLNKVFRCGHLAQQSCHHVVCPHLISQCLVYIVAPIKLPDHTMGGSRWQIMWENWMGFLAPGFKPGPALGYCRHLGSKQMSEK